MAILNTLLVNGDGTLLRQWTAGQDFANIDEGIASADGLAVGSNDNLTTSIFTSFSLSNVNADFGNINTLSFRVRYRVIGAQTNTRNLKIRIETQNTHPDVPTLLAAADSSSTTQVVANGITNTAFQNSAVIAFTYVNTAASKVEWDDAIVILELQIVKNMGGDTNGVQVDTLEITGTYTAATVALNLPADIASFTLTNQSAVLRANRRIPADVSSYAFTGSIVNITKGKRVEISEGIFTLTGINAALTKTNLHRLTADIANYTHTGSTISISVARRIPITISSYSFTGQTSSLEFGRRLVGTIQSYTHTGQSAITKVTRQLPITISSYFFTGTNATLRGARKIICDQGGYTFTGQSADLTLPTDELILSADITSYSFTGQTAGLRVFRKLPVTEGSISITSINTSLPLGRRVSCAQSSVLLSGQNATLTHGLDIDPVLTADIGSVVLTGQSVQFILGKTLVAAHGELSLTGSEISYGRTYILAAGLQSYIISSSGALVTRPGDLIKNKRRFVGNFQDIKHRR